MTAVAAASSALTAVVCDDRPADRRRSSFLLTRCGFTVVGEVDGFVGLLTGVLRSQPRVALLTLPLMGTSGLTAISALRAAAPACELVLLCAFSNLDDAARQAGAYAVLREDDPQSLRSALCGLARPASLPSSQRTPDYNRAGGQIGTSSMTPGSVGSSTTKPFS